MAQYILNERLEMIKPEGPVIIVFYHPYSAATNPALEQQQNQF